MADVDKTDKRAKDLAAEIQNMLKKIQGKRNKNALTLSVLPVSSFLVFNILKFIFTSSKIVSNTIHWQSVPKYLLDWLFFVCLKLC